MLQSNATPHWYVVHTYAGYENRVAANLEKIVENRGLGHLILSVKIPTEVVIDPEDDTKKEERKLFPCYVFVKMIMNDESWHVVRNTRGVTGFVGPGSQPVVLTDEEVAAHGVEAVIAALPFRVGDHVLVKDGPLKGHLTDAVVEEISPDNKRVKVSASLHGRNTKIELDAALLALDE